MDVVAPYPMNERQDLRSCKTAINRHPSIVTRTGCTQNE